MAFQPENITKEHVIQAIKDIDAGDIGFRKSTKFDILYRGRTYPPKDVMRKAHEFATGEYLWNPGGGEPTNKYLKALGFEIVLKDLDKFTWIETHYDLVDYLIEHEDNQIGLINILKDLKITGFEDVDFNDVSIPLTEIDPFTFFCYIYKHGPEKRLELLKALAEKLELSIPSDDLGIPSANAQKVWMFPFKKNRLNNEIQRLWHFFKKAVDFEVDNELFDDVLTITNVGKIKITEGLFNINPIEYFPINGPTKPYLKEVLGVNTNFKTFKDYQGILEKIRDKTNKPFYQISYEAWLWNDQQKKINYWLFQGNPKYYDVIGALKNNAINTWKVAAHKDKIKLGDKIILWLSGQNSGCYALATVTSEVGKIEMNPDEIQYYKTEYDENEDRVTIEIDKDFSRNPILWESIKNESILKDLKSGNQGTNFSATKAEYDYFNAMEQFNIDTFITHYIKACNETDWLDNELYKFEWAKWVHDKANFDTTGDALLFQLALDSQKESYTNSTGVQFIKQGAREKMSKYIGIDDIRYFREFKEGKTLTEIGFEFRNMSFPIVSCWLSVFFPDKIYPVSRTSFADVVRKLFNAKVNNSNISFIEDLQPYCLQIDSKLKTTTKYQTLLKEKLQLPELTQLEYNWAVQDFLLYIDRHPELFNIDTTTTTQTKNTMSANNLNQILFGPPGTGKTFNTINEALKIVDPTYFETHQNDRKKLTDRFKELLIKDSDENKGQIAFCTFHQSFSYEDFVEGIKPKTTESKSVFYHTEPGVFKRICQLADSYNSTVKVKTQGILSWNEEQFNKASFYKLSLGEANNPDDREIYEYCRDNGYIAIGFGQENDFSGLSESDIKEKCEDLKLESIAGQQMYTFIHYLKKNNYVLISNGNKYIRAIGKVTGDYEYKAESPIRYNHFRKVEWLFVDENIPVEEIYNIGLSQRTMYKIDESLLKRDFFTNNGQETLMPDLVKEEKNYVLIIDEINRGNVSSIFGELITLIEKDKRAGCDEELEVTLPYSKEPFKVPSNVYLIGTMNTADRSIEALDTALRRRFSFKEFPPKPYLIKTEGESSKNSGMVDGIDLENLLNTINTRIEKLIDKDHKIGHSYFLKVNNKEKLVHAFKNEIIPLLEEYFFGDYGKIGLVLGSSFVEKVNHEFDFANFEHYDVDIQSDLKEKAVFKIKNEDQWDFTTI